MLRNPNIPYFPLIMQLHIKYWDTHQFVWEVKASTISDQNLFYNWGRISDKESPSFVTKLPSLHYLFWNTIANKIMLFCMPNNVSGYYQKREPMHFFIIKLLFFVLHFFLKKFSNVTNFKTYSKFAFLHPSNLIVF